MLMPVISQTGLHTQRKDEMDKEEEKRKIEELFGPHPMNLKGFSKTVKARFKEATRRTNKQNEYINYPRDNIREFATGNC